jgi:peptidoglycan/LPS O-acetylase OafA/YrhL
VDNGGMGIRYRPEIDGLRAIAVLAVVLYHAGLGGAGYVGVDVFFVISGYLITSILLVEAQSTGTIGLLGFYARRVRRILPALLVVVAATLAMGRLLLSEAQVVMLERSGAASLLFGANFFFQANTGGYFDATADELPLLHLWSLAIEEQFYLAWPLLLSVLVPARRGRWVLPALAGFALASFALAAWLVGRGPDGAELAFYQTPARFWELALGGLVAALPVRAGPRVMAPLGLAAVLAACIFLLHPFPGPGAVPAVAGAAVLLLAVHGCGPTGMAGAWLRSRPMVGIGLVSYSLYLWHWPLLALYRATIIGDGDIRVRFALCLVALVLSVASYRYVEQPFRKSKTGKGRTVAVGAGVCVALAAVSFALAAHSRFAPPPADDPLALRAEHDFPSKACHDTGMQAPRIKCARTPSTRIAIWGDSLAYAWAPGMRRFDAHSVEFSRDSCRPYLGYLPPKPYPADVKCERFNDLVARQVQGLNTLVLVAVWDAGQGAALGRTLDAVAPRVGRVVVLGPTPRMRGEVARCIRRHAEAECAISRAAFDAQAAPVLAALRAAARAHPNVEVVDLADAFCTATVCPPVRGGVPLYWDKFHVSSSMATSVALPLEITAAARRSLPGT